MSSGNYERQSQFEVKYKKGTASKNSLFGEHFIYYETDGNSKIISIEKIYNDRGSLNRAVEEVKKKILNKHDYILNLLDYSVEVQKNWCATFYLLRVFYEYPEQSLKKIILDWKKQTDPYENRSNEDNPIHNEKSEALTHLLYHQISANAFLQENNIHHGDITPSNIFRTNQGDFKLAFRTNQMMSTERQQLDKILKHEPLYLSPTLYKNLKAKNIQNIPHDPTKSDIFSLGLCILEAGLEKSIQGIYSNHNQINQQELDRYLGELEEKYDDNPLLYTSVQKMLDVDESERADFTGLKEAMPDYQEICDFFYKLKHGLLVDEEDDNSFNEVSQDFDNGNFNKNQNIHFQENPQFQQNSNSQNYDYYEDDQQNNFYDDQQQNQFNSQPNNQQQYSYNDNQMVQNNNNQMGQNHGNNLSHDFQQNQQFQKNNQPHEITVNANPKQIVVNSDPINAYTHNPNKYQNFNPYQNDNTQDDFFDVFDEPQNNNFSQQPVKKNSMPTNYQTTPIQNTQINQPQQFTQYEPQLSKTTPQQNFFNYEQQNHIQSNNYQARKQSQPQVYAQPKVQQQNSYGGNYQQGSETQMINGIPHQRKVEMRQERGPNGQLVQKQVVTYVPVNQNVSYGSSQHQYSNLNNTFSTTVSQPQQNHQKYVYGNYQLIWKSKIKIKLQNLSQKNGMLLLYGRGILTQKNVLYVNIIQVNVVLIVIMKVSKNVFLYGVIVNILIINIVQKIGQSVVSYVHYVLHLGSYLKKLYTMSEQYQKKLQEYENSQEFKTLPKYPNKEPMKEVNRHNQGVLNSLQNAHKKNFKTNYKILEKHLLILKGKSKSYVEAFDYVKNHFKELDQKKQILEKVKKQTRQVEKLRDQMEGQRKKAYKDSEVKISEDKILTGDRIKELEQTLNKRESEVFQLKQRNEIAKQTNEHLIKSKDDILKQIDSNLKEMDKNYEEKSVQVKEFIDKQKNGVDDFEKQLENMQNIPEKKQKEEEYSKTYQERADKVLSYAQKYNDMLNDTFADLKKVKKMSEKVANKNNKQSNNRLKELKKVQQLNKKVWDYLTINEGYRTKIAQEQKKQQILQKMANDLENKIQELKE